MKLLERRRQAAAAERRLVHERTLWRARTAPLRRRVAPHRPALLAGGGFLAGVFAGLLPWGWFARVGGTLFSAAALALRSPLGTLLLETAVRRANAPGESAGD